MIQRLLDIISLSARFHVVHKYVPAVFYFMNVLAKKPSKLPRSLKISLSVSNGHTGYKALLLVLDRCFLIGPNPKEAIFHRLSFIK